MADIVLAEFGGQAWLVGGEEYIDDLLANTLPQHVTIELVACDSKTNVNLLWSQHSRDAGELGVPWLIHPAIVARERRRLAPQHTVFFAQWSALIDDEGRAEIRSAGLWAAQNEGSAVVLIRFVSANSPPGVADLANLRCRLIEAELVRHGVPGDRIERETRDVSSVPGMQEESQQVNIAVRLK